MLAGVREEQEESRQYSKTWTWTRLLYGRASGEGSPQFLHLRYQLSDTYRGGHHQHPSNSKSAVWGYAPLPT